MFVNVVLEEYFMRVMSFREYFMGVNNPDSEVLIHFDGWGSEYDYWCSSCSPELHPQGWCQSHNWELQTPLSELLRLDIDGALATLSFTQTKVGHRGSSTLMIQTHQLLRKHCSVKYVGVHSQPHVVVCQ